MSFDIPKLVRSPGCDHGHDEESRNGRDIKIDILDGYIRTPEVFRVISEKTGEPEGYRNPPGEVMGHMGLSGEREGRQAGPRASSPLGPNWTRRGGRRPPFLLPPHFLPPPSRSPTPTRRRRTPGAPIGAGRPPPLDPLYTGPGGTPRHKLIHVIIFLSVCGAPFHHSPR